MIFITKPLVDDLTRSLSSSSSVVTPESEDYKKSIARWNDAAVRSASVVVFPSSAEDVSKVVLWSKASGLELAICGGGHAVSGSSSTEGGVCIDLSKMRNVTVDAQGKSITAQGGALWKDVDDAAAEHNLAAVGGVVNHTGIGGLTLGGGYGWLTGAYGLVIDNLLAVELVLTDGRIVNASKDENEDLFWAIRGAGACFGVATSFTYNAHEQKNSVWSGVLVFLPTSLSAVVEFANNLVAEGNSKTAMAVAFGAPPPHFQPALVVPVFYNGSEEEANEEFKGLIELGPVANMTSMMPYAAVNSILNPMSAHGGRKSIKGTVFVPALDPDFAQGIFDDTISFIKSNPDAGQTIVIHEYLPFNRVNSVSQTETSFANRGPICNVAIWPGWVGENLDEVCRNWSRVMAAKFEKEFQKKVAKVAGDLAKFGVDAYANYSDSTDYTATAMFGRNTERLVELKKRFDPENVFRKYCNLLARH